MTEISRKSLGDTYFGIYTAEKQEQKNQKKLMACGKGDDLDNLFTDSF